jgi:hypothetical protein
MPDVHVPRLTGKSALKVAMEVALIAVGVFLGLMGEQWREHRQHAELARSSLQRFRAEIDANRKAVLAVSDYHVATKKKIDTFFASDPRTRKRSDVGISGLRPAFFEHTAWDLAVATQALTYVDSDLAFALSRAYSAQQNYSGLTGGILQAMYLRPPAEDFEPFLRAVTVYYGDVVNIEPSLVKMYDDLLPRIDHALSD